PSHWRRNLWLMAALIGGGAAIAGFYVSSSRTDAIEMERLEQFRAAVAETCDAPGFAGPTPPLLKDMYLTSAPFRDAIDRQREALSVGKSCEVVLKALRAADFPMPAPSEPRP